MGALAPALTWTSVISRLCTFEADAELRVLAGHIGHPLDQGAVRLDIGADDSYIVYGLPVDERTLCIVRQYTDAYDVRLARIRSQPVELVQKEEAALAVSRPPQLSLADLPTEAPGLTIMLGTALGALVGAVAGGKGAAMGAIIGGSAALAAVGVSNAESSPATAQAAQTMFLGVSTAALGSSTAKRPALPPAPKRPTASRTESRADRFDRADFEVRRRASRTKK